MFLLPLEDDCKMRDEQAVHFQVPQPRDTPRDACVPFWPWVCKDMDINPNERTAKDRFPISRRSERLPLR